MIVCEVRPHARWWAPVAGAVAALTVGGACPGQIQSSREVVTVTVTPGRMAGRPGEVIPVAVVLDHRAKWHTQAGQQAAGEVAVDPDAIPTAVAATVDGERFLVRTDAIQWPPATVIETRAMGPASKMPVFKDRTVIYLPWEVRPDAKAGNVDVGISVTYQACDDRVCLAPVEGQRFDLTLAVSPSASDTGWTYPDLFQNYRPVTASLPPRATVSPEGIGLLTILTATLVAVGVIGVVVIAVLRRAGANPRRP